MQKLFLAGVLLMLTSGICLAADSTAATASNSSIQQAASQTVDDGNAPMVINPNTGQLYRAPFLHGTFDSVSATQLIIKGRTNHEPITFLLKGPIPVYDKDKKHITFNDLKVDDHLKVHFQKNPDFTMTAVAVYQVNN